MFCIPPHLHEEVFQSRYEPYRQTESTVQAVKVTTVLPPYSPSFHRPLSTLAVSEKEFLYLRDVEQGNMNLLPLYEKSYHNDNQPYDPCMPSKKKRFPFKLILILALLFAFIQLFLQLPPSLNSPFTLTRIMSSSSNYVKPLDPTFINRCQNIKKPNAEIFVNRLNKISSILPSDTIWISEPSASTSYFLGGFSEDDWFLSERPFLVAINSNLEIYIVTPSFEFNRAKLLFNNLPKEIQKKTNWLEWKENQSPYNILSEYLENNNTGINKFVLDDNVREFVSRGLRNVLQESKAGEDEEGENLEDQIRSLRERKDDWEIDMLKCANQFTLHAIRKTRERMYIGITESQIGKILEEEMDKTGLVGGEGLVLFGENAALPHGSGTDRKLIKTDLILIDVGGKWGGYVSDITRTFALPSSKIAKSHIDLWETVRKAQKAPYELLISSPDKDNITFGELDKSARNLITNWKNRDSLLLFSKEEEVKGDEVDFSIFTHRLGHGIGLEGHESPYLVQGELQGDKQIEQGNVFSLEPGIYLPSDHKKVNGLSGIGVRLEDCFVLKKDDHTHGWTGEWLSGPVEKFGDI